MASYEERIAINHIDGTVIVCELSETREGETVVRRLAADRRDTYGGSGDEIPVSAFYAILRRARLRP